MKNHDRKDIQGNKVLETCQCYRCHVHITWEQRCPAKKAKCSTCSKLGHFANGSDNESISALWNANNLLKEVTISTEVYSYCNHIQQWSTNAKIIDAITLMFYKAMVFQSNLVTSNHTLTTHINQLKQVLFTRFTI